MIMAKQARGEKLVKQANKMYAKYQDLCRETKELFTDLSEKTEAITDVERDYIYAKSDKLEAKKEAIWDIYREFCTEFELWGDVE
jgi:hypothetical protein